MNEKACLNYNPFQGDEGDTRLMSDKFVTTRKPHDCSICFEIIPSGVHVRARREVSKGFRNAMTFYFCVPCCEAMAMSWDYEDNGRAISERCEIGMLTLMSGYPWLPCPICHGTEGCDHSVPERMRAAQKSNLGRK